STRPFDPSRAGPPEVAPLKRKLQAEEVVPRRRQPEAPQASVPEVLSEVKQPQDWPAGYFPLHQDQVAARAARLALPEARAPRRRAAGAPGLRPACPCAFPAPGVR